MDAIQTIYIALFGRPADPLGLDYFMAETNNGADLSAIGDLAGQAEYQDRFVGMSNQQIITSIYQSLFGRNPEQAGLEYFLAELESGRQNINTIAINIAHGARGADADVLANKIVAADAFTAAIDTPNEIAGYVGDKAAEQGRLFLQDITADDATIPDAAAVALAVQKAVAAGNASGGDFSLTAGMDFADSNVAFTNGPIAPVASDFRFTSDNQTVNATNITLGNVIGFGPDVLQDASTADNDILNVSVVGSISAISGALVQNIENINLTLTNADGNFDLSNYTGVKNITLTGSLHATSGAADILYITDIANSGVTHIDASAVQAGEYNLDSVEVNDASADQNITYKGGAGGDRVYLGDGDNNIDLGAGANWAGFGDGNNVVKGGSQADTVAVGGGDNDVDLGGGSNQFTAGHGNNKYVGGAGVDKVYVGNGDNNISTGAGNDVIQAGNGRNVIDAGAGDDVITIGNDDNTITGGAGADKITLGFGSGNNQLLYSEGDTGLSPSSIDVITGFQSGGDKFVFADAGSAVNYTEFNAVGMSFAAAQAAADLQFFNNVDLQYVFAYNASGNGYLFGSNSPANDGHADFAIELAGATNANALGYFDIVA